MSSMENGTTRSGRTKDNVYIILSQFLTGFSENLPEHPAAFPWLARLDAALASRPYGQSESASRGA